MKLSEAIRLGAMLKPQAFGKLSDGVGTCALGAAEDAVGMSWFAAWPLQHPAFTAGCPACKYVPDVIDQATPAHLNDVHRWTREQIADWVESIEPSTEGDNERTASTPATDAVPVAVGDGGR